LWGELNQYFGVQQAFDASMANLRIVRVSLGLEKLPFGAAGLDTGYVIVLPDSRKFLVNGGMNA